MIKVCGTKGIFCTVYISTSHLIRHRPSGLGKQLNTLKLYYLNNQTSLRSQLAYWKLCKNNIYAVFVTKAYKTKLFIDIDVNDLGVFLNASSLGAIAYKHEHYTYLFPIRNYCYVPTSLVTSRTQLVFLNWNSCQVD